jgi:hypothetical protein
VNTEYPWRAKYALAVHESDNSKITSRIDDALKAIQKRQASTAPIDELERSAINNAVLALEALKPAPTGRA